eukprot:1837824-Prymnesium_polylepis.1
MAWRWRDDGVIGACGVGRRGQVLFVEFDAYVLPVVMPSEGVDHISRRVKTGPQPNADELIKIKRIVEQVGPRRCLA